MSPHEPQDFVRRCVNLAQPRLGAKALYASDEFFAAKERMLNPEPALFIAGKYDDHGKWMDGWETRRKRAAGHDYCVLTLGVPGVIEGIDIDTSHFTGNYPQAASLDACRASGDDLERADWRTLVPATSLKGDAHHYLAVHADQVWSHVRLNIYPDGGVARLRVYGRVFCDWGQRDRSQLYDLAALQHGGRIVGYNDAHFGAADNMLAPGRGANMGDAWETRRRREPGHDWAVIALGSAGNIRRVIVDTAHHKGNYPDRCSMQAARVAAGTDQSIVTQSMFWETLLPEQKLEADTVHEFQAQLRELGPVTHVRLNIIPDGGVSRLRVLGQLA